MVRKLITKGEEKKDCSGTKESGRPTLSTTTVAAKDNQQP